MARWLAMIALATLTLVGCGGGGGGTNVPVRTGGTTTPPTVGASEPQWVAGVYPAASTFKDRCAVPRVGVDIEGNPFPDMAGSLLREKFWLRSWTNETYLWNNEVLDQNPTSFGSRTDYFAVLRTNAVTPSGKDKDDFHFSEPTTEFLARRNSAASAGYGARLVALRTSPPRDYRVVFTEPNSPAAQVENGSPAFKRGTRILSIDGVDLVNGSSEAEINALNAGLFPAQPGEVHTFVVRDEGATSTRTVALTSANVVPKPVNRTAVFDTPTGKVGYILFNTFSPFASEIEIANAMTLMRNEGVTDLVLDLRYNGGGLLAVASQLSYMIVGPVPTAGQKFERLRFNATAGSINPVTRERNDPIPFYSTGLGFSLANGTPLQSLNLSRVFILTTAGTCSASEAVINGLRGIDIEVILIGATTCGKPFGFYPQDNCGETYYTIQFQGVNDKGFGDYADGFVPNNAPGVFGVRAPGCAVADDYSRELGDATEALTATALAYREIGQCPASPAPPPPALKDDPSAVDPALVIPLREGIFESNRDMRIPGVQ